MDVEAPSADKALPLDVVGPPTPTPEASTMADRAHMGSTPIQPQSREEVPEDDASAGVGAATPTAAESPPGSETPVPEGGDLASPLRLIQLLYRRRLIVIPMILLAAVSLVVAHRVSPPLYRANGSILLFIPPTAQHAALIPANGITPGSVDTNNPYLDMDSLDVTADILSNTLTTSEESRILRAQGVKGSYSISPDNSAFHGPIVDVSMKAPSPDDAIRSTRLVIGELTRQLAAIQKQQGTDPKYFVKVSTVNGPDAATPVRPLTAPLLALALLELAAIVGVALVADKWVNRRARGDKPTLLAENASDTEQDQPLGSGV